MTTTTPHWSPALRVLRSPLDPRVWVPTDILEPNDAVSMHAASLTAVKRWAVEHARAFGAKYDHPVLEYKWVRESSDSILLSVLEE